MSEEAHVPRMKPAGDAAPPAPKRIFKQAAAVAGDLGYGIALDGRGVRTPARHPLVVPGAALADAIVGEWNAQGERIDHRTMPLTRLANTALDNVCGREGEIADEIAAFAGNDLVCYRSTTPASLIAREAAAWDPILDWAAEEFGGRFSVTAGVMHVAQPEAAISRLRAALGHADAFELTAFHNMTTLSGSALLALAVAGDVFAPDDAWERAHVDEDWQIEQWGHDAEAAARRRQRHDDFAAAFRFLTHVRAG